MPVDLSIPNSIIGAYAKGRAELLERQRRVDELTQQNIENEQRKAQLAEQQRQFDIQEQGRRDALEQQHKEFLASLDIQKSLANLQKVEALGKKQEEAAKTGLAFGFQKLPQIPGLTIPQEENTFIGDPNLGIGDVQFNAPTPEAYAQRQAALGSILRAPQRAEDKEDYLFKINADQGKEEYLANLNSKNRLSVESQLLGVEAGYKAAQSERDYRHELGLANLRGQWDYLVSGGKQPVEAWTDLKIDPATAKAHNLPEGTTWGQLGIAQMDAEGKKKFFDYTQMEPEITNVLSLFAEKAAQLQKNYPNQYPDDLAGNKKALEDAYKAFFSGSAGHLQDAFPNVFTDEFVNTVRPSLAKVFLLMKEEAKLGANLAGNEQKALEGYVLGGERSIPADTAMKILSRSLPILRESRWNTVQTFSKKTRNSGGPGPDFSGIERLQIPAGLIDPRFAPK